jgi:hypothetical protein
MKRLFTFGCSFTQYWRWPTWADALGKQFAFYENWGLCGSGNSFVLYSLMECHQRHHIKPSDSVYVMWTNTSREDRYVQRSWLQGGNVYWNQDGVLGSDYVKKFACERGYLIRDLAVISAVKQLLEAWQCDWKFFSMVPLASTNSDSDLGQNPSRAPGPDHDVRELYQDVLAVFAPSLFETVFAGNWNSRAGAPDCNNGPRRDFHPTPQEHVEYLDIVAPGLLFDPAAREWMAQCDQLAKDNRLVWSEPNRAQGRL